MATNFTKKTAAIALAAGLAFSGSAGIVAAPVAQAQELSTLKNADGTVKADGKITIHKRVGAGTHGTPNANGSAQEGVAGAPLEGATFQIQKINVDMTTDEGFAKAATLQKTGTPGGRETGGVNYAELNKLSPKFDTTFETKSGKTNDQGELVFDTLPAGAYLVTETAVPENQNGVYVPSAPFIVYVPMPDPEASTGDKWNRDVHVYPKNTELTVTKEVADAGKQPINAETADKTFTYTVNSPVPMLPPQRKLTELNVVDTFKKGDFVGEDLKIAKVEIVEADGTVKQKLAPAQNPAQPGENEYTVSGPTALGEPIKDDAGKILADTTRTVTVTNADTLAKLAPGDMLRVTLTGEVAKVAQPDDPTGTEDGEITNFAHTTGKTQVTGDPEFEDTENPTPPDEFETPKDRVDTYIAAVKVVKHKKGAETELLSGAEFTVFSVPGDKACAANTEGRKDIVTKFEVNGEAVINALHVTDYVNDVAVTPSVDTLKFCIVETKAPSGYQLDTTVREIQATKADSQKQGLTPGTDPAQKFNFASEIKIPNEERSPLQLPQTGGMGVIALILAGLALLGGGAYAARRKTA